MTRKILLSPGFGAGWSSWNSGETAKYMLTYQPIIDFLEHGGKFPSTEGDKLLTQLEQECKEKFDEDYVCVLGADDLTVITVDGLVRIHEYDGSESFETKGSYDGWM